MEHAHHIFHIGIKSNKTRALQIITFTFSTVGFVLSIASLLLLIFTAILFAEWRKKYKNQVLIHFMVARFLFVLWRYMFDASLVFGFHPSAIFIMNLDSMIHVFTELTLVTWMFVFTKTLYESLVVVMIVPSRHRLLKASLYSWLIPLIGSVIIIKVVQGQQEIELFDYLFFFFILKWPLLFWNGVLLVQTLRSLSSKNRTLCHNRPENNRKIVVTMVFLIFVFSFQQISHDVFKIVYLIMKHVHSETTSFVTTWMIVINIISLYYCPLSISFWVIYNNNTRELWKNYIKKKFNT